MQNGRKQAVMLPTKALHLVVSNDPVRAYGFTNLEAFGSDEVDLQKAATICSIQSMMKPRSFSAVLLSYISDLNCNASLDLACLFFFCSHSVDRVLLLYLLGTERVDGIEEVVPEGEI